MTAAACKAAICDGEAQGRMRTALDKIYAVREASIDLRVAHSEIYIKHIKRAQKEADTLIMESGE